MSQNYTEYLKHVVLFEEIAKVDGAIETISNCLFEKQFSPKQPILEEGTPGQELLILIEGKVEVFKTTPDGEEFIVAHLEANPSQKHFAFFGEGALVDSDRRSATIKAVSLCRCLVLSQDKFSDFCKQNPHWGLPIYRRIARGVMTRLQRSNHDLLLLYKALVSEIRGD